jgi:hypothetical protein
MIKNEQNRKNEKWAGSHWILWRGAEQDLVRFEEEEEASLPAGRGAKTLYPTTPVCEQVKMETQRRLS